MVPSLAVASIVVERLEGLKMMFPKPSVDIEDVDRNCPAGLTKCIAQTNLNSYRSVVCLSAQRYWSTAAFIFAFGQPNGRASKCSSELPTVCWRR